MQILLGILMAVGLLLIRGLTIKTLWGWFVCQQFSLPALSLATAMGLSLLMSVVIQRKYYLKCEIDEMKNISSVVWMATSMFNALLQVIAMMTILAFGFAIHSWW